MEAGDILLNVDGKTINIKEYFTIPTYLPQLKQDYIDIHGEKVSNETQTIKVAILKAEDVGRLVFSRIVGTPVEKPIEVDFKYIPLEKYRSDETLQKALITSTLNFILVYLLQLRTLMFSYSSSIDPLKIPENLPKNLENMLLSLSNEAIRKLNTLILKRNAGQEVELGSLTEELKNTEEIKSMITLFYTFWAIGGLALPELTSVVFIFYFYLLDLLKIAPFDLWSSLEDKLESVGIFELNFEVPLTQ